MRQLGTIYGATMNCQNLASFCLLVAVKWLAVAFNSKLAMLVNAMMLVFGSRASEGLAPDSNREQIFQKMFVYQIT